MKDLLKEPLIHFMLIGVALFLVFAVVNREEVNSEDTIEVDAGRIEQLAIVFQKTWQRPPTREELQALIDDYVLEEIYYRQAVAMGIDRDDTIIRRRLRQKLEFLTDDLTSLGKATEAELQTYLAEHPEKFRESPTFSFQQIYINPEKQDKDAVAKLLEQARAGNMESPGSGLLPGRFEESTVGTIDGQFGIGFAAQLDKLEPGNWEGPIESGLGMHLVLVEEKTAGRLPALADIQQQVEREWSNDQLVAARKEMNRRLRQQYEVVVHWPESSASNEDPGEGSTE